MKGSITTANLSLLIGFRGEDVLVHKQEGIYSMIRYFHIMKVNDTSYQGYTELLWSPWSINNLLLLSFSGRFPTEENVLLKENE